MDGSIVRITLQDFMTYKKVVFDAGPNINLIIGPNGAGKSTIVCAMLLGLGGKPKLLGRTVALNSYIRTSCKIARIEIELKNSRGDNYVITRTITVDGKSSWQLGLTAATQKQVEDLVSKLNIQVYNLCQFLPQDRVADFSKMNPQQLLENTERCIEVEMVNMMEKKTLLQKVEELKQKRAWLLHNSMQSRVMKMKVDKKNATKYSAMHEKRYEPMERIIEAAKAKVKETERSLGAVNAEAKRKLAALTDMLESIEKTEDLIKENRQDCERKIQAEQLRQKEVSYLLQQINKLQNDLKGSTKESVNALRTELDVVKKQMNEKTDCISRLRHEREKHRSDLENITHKIGLQKEEQRKIQDVANQRLELLRRKHKDVYDAVMSLRENKNKFHHHIYDPMMLEINVTNPSDAKYIEKMIPHRDLLAFTCEDKEDMNSLVSIFRDQKNLKINVVHSGSEHRPFSSFKPNVPISNLRHLGFYTYVVDMITAPEPIMKYLCRMYHIHNIPVGDSSTFTCSDQVPGSFNYFFSDKHVFQVRCSKYSGEKSTNTSEIPDPFYLAISTNVQLLQQVQDKLIDLNGQKQQKISTLEDIQKQMHQIEVEMEEMRSRKHSLMERMEQLRTVEVKLSAKQRQWENLEQEKLDPELEKAKCRADNQLLVLKLTDQNVQMIKLFNHYDQSLIENQILHQELENVRNETTKREMESRHLLQKWNEAKMMALNIEEKLHEAEIELKRLFEEAKAMTGGVSPDDVEFEKFRSVFLGFGNTEEEVNREIQETKAKADCLRDANEMVIQDYEARKSQIVSLTADIQIREKESETLKEEMARISGLWLPPLRKLMSQFNKKYGECFARLGCVGEVTLFTGDDEKDYEQYGLNIKVKFRDGEQLQELTQRLQSGGERAVATAIYLISLQEITHVPFCCVDEINQGMDAINERMIFELMVTTSKRIGSAQYFFLTPKLLPSLLYDHTVVVRCIMNGAGALSSDDWNISDILRKKARLSRKQL
ncbi:structural maintenance of chromosomes protein 5 isoform X3 [Zootermopsis nevadensis]|uniref:structural maintenance of chromosomes protein 5 isoform X3 n=1 Tax=Zootermopsis nevadensis TaxID=136037 RepID=UPI000B8E44EF|nr:structural maintenance of chromosomes protein 5 isoform X3 [Zootermopsis nevadensis]